MKLNICSGPNLFPFDGWINYDHEDFDYYIDWIKGETTAHMTYLQNLINYVKGGGELASIKHDLRTGLPQHTDNSVDLIYFGQAVEHFNPIFEVPKIIKECYRVLVPGGVLRIITPDLDLLINAYLSGEMDKFAIEQPEFYKNVDASAQLAMIMYGSCGETSTCSKYEGHQFLFTQKSLTKVLNDAGFKNIKFYYEAGISHSTIMAKECIDQGMTHSMICEAVK